MQFSSLNKDLDTDNSNSQHLLSDLQDQNRNNFNFLDNSNASATSSFDFNKRKRSSDGSGSGYSDKIDMKTSFADLNPQDNFNQTKFNNMTKNHPINSKSPNAGLSIDKKTGQLETMLMLKDIASSGNVPKKERRRKKTETDSSNKTNLSTSVMVSNMQLMPPPSTSSIVTSITNLTNITANSPTSSGGNTYGFIDSELNSSAIGSPALRPITLNVKPSSMNTANTNITGRFLMLKM